MVSAFLDANILLDVMERRPFELSSSESIITAGEERHIQLYTSESVISNILYIAKLPQLPRVLLLMTSYLEVLPNNTALIRQALNSPFQDKEDAILYYLALHHNIDYFITRDKKDFKRYAVAALPVMSPKDFIRAVK